MAKRGPKPAGLSGMSLEQLKHFAKTGAEATLTRLRQEIEIIERTFPELSSAKGRAKVIATAQKKTRNMSAAAREAVSARMKKYWAARKKAEAKTGR